MHSEPSADFTDPRVDDRIRRHTAPRVMERIDQLTQSSLDATAGAGRDAIVARIKDLDREWDVDRALMANFALAGGLSFFLSQRRWGWTPWRPILGAQVAFLLMHAVVGWCPPLVIFRRLGVRTAKEISAERSALVARLGSLPLPPISTRSMPGPEEDAVSPAAKPWSPELPERQAEADRES